MSTIDETVSFSLEVNVQEAYENIRKLQTVAYRTLDIFRRIGLPEEIDAAAMKVQQFIALMNQARLAAIALQTASGPYGWALAAIGVVSTALSTSDFLMDLG